MGYVFSHGLNDLFPITEAVSDTGKAMLSSEMDFLYIFKVYEGGLSFHGGFIGVCIAYIFYAKKYSVHPFTIADWVVPIVPIVPMGITLSVPMIFAGAIMMLLAYRWNKYDHESVLAP